MKDSKRTYKVLIEYYSLDGEVEVQEVDVKCLTSLPLNIERWCDEIEQLGGVVSQFYLIPVRETN